MFFDHNRAVLIHERRKGTERVVRSRMVATGERIRTTLRDQTVPLITSRCLVCINAGVSIQLRPSSFPRYIVASSRVGAALRALRASWRPPRWPLLRPRRGMLQPPSFNPLVGQGMHTAGGFNCRYAPRRWAPGIVPSHEITSRR